MKEKLTDQGNMLQKMEQRQRVLTTDKDRRICRENLEAINKKINKQRVDYELEKRYGY